MVKIRTSIAIGLTFALVILVSTLLVSESKSHREKNFIQTEIPVVVKPLKVGDELVPVDIQCEPVLIERPDTVENYTCFFVNRTNKSIRAFGVRHSIVFDADGEPGRNSRLYVTDTYIHPDMSDVKKPLEPGDKRYIGPPGPIVQPGSFIKALELEPVHVEFSDGTTGGTDVSSIEMIGKIRDGAARYKHTLRQEYLKSRLVESILPRLRENFTGDSQNSWTLYQRVGANAYRRFLEEKHEKAGSAAVGKILSN